MGELDEVDGAHMHLFAFRRDLTGFQHITPEPGRGHVVVGGAQPQPRVRGT